MASNVVEYILKLTGGDEASESLRGVSKEAGVADVSLAGLAGATAVVGAALLAGAAAAFQFAQQIADAVNDVTDLSTRTGVASETILGLKLAFEGSGQSAAQMESTLQQVTARISSAAAGSTAAADGFGALGVSLTDAEGGLRSTDDVLRETLASIQALPDPTERAVAATNALGRSGARMVQALGDGKLDDYVETARVIGLDVGPAAAAATANWQREVATLNTTLEATPQRIADAFGMDSGGAGILEVFNTSLLFSLNLLNEASDQFVSQFDLMGRAVDAFTSGDLSGAAGLVGELYGGDQFAWIDSATEATEKQLEALDALRGSTTGGGSGGGGGGGYRGGGSGGDGWTDGGFLNKLTNPGAITGSSVAGGFSGLSALLDFGDFSRMDMLGARAARFQHDNPNAAGNVQAGAGALGGLATGNVNPLLSLIPGGGLLGGVANVGALGAGGVEDMLDTFTEAVKGGLEALPEILSTVIPEFAVSIVTELIPALISASPQIFAALITGLANTLLPGGDSDQSFGERLASAGQIASLAVGAGNSFGSSPSDALSLASSGSRGRTSSSITRPRAPLQAGPGGGEVRVILGGDLGALIDRIDIEQGPNGTRPRST